MSIKFMLCVISAFNIIYCASGTACGSNIQGTLRKMCSKKYPEHLIEKYLDEIVNKNDLYAFYEEINKKFILLTQKRQELTECDLLEIVAPRIFKCLIGNSVETISYDIDVFNTTMQCFSINEEFKLLFVEELADFCGYVPDERIADYIIHYVSLPEDSIRQPRLLAFNNGYHKHLSLPCLLIAITLSLSNLLY